MKQLLLFLTTILAINSYSQISFEKGYYIDNSGQKIECLIKNKDWAFNPIDFKYKTSENEDTKTIGIQSVQEFGIYDVAKYIRKTVNVDISSVDINDLSVDRNPIFQEQQLFLKVIAEGKANLYESGDPKKYFFNIEGSNIEQLVFKNYKITNTQIGTNNLFRQQLLTNLVCSTIKMNELEKLDYRKSTLITFFNKYNKCSNPEAINPKEKEYRDVLNLTLRPRLNNSSFTIENDIYPKGVTDFGKKIGFGFGIEGEYILPFNKNKWSIILEPTYQSFKGEKTDTYSYPGVGSWTKKLEVNYTSIEIPLGLRYYFFLNNNSKIFVNSSFVYDLSLNSTVKYKNSSFAGSVDFENGVNFAFGIGYKIHDKYSLEMRYNTSRDNFNYYFDWHSDYKTIAIIFGYTLF